MKKILWIVNTPLGPLGEAIYGKRSGGVWMDALLEDFKKSSDYQVVVATTAAIKDKLEIEEDGITYIALPDAPPLLYNEEKKENKNNWKEFISDIKPDLIQVWGTEFTQGLCALREAGTIPSVIYMQGVCKAIAENYEAGISIGELKKTVTFRDLVRHDSILQQKAKFESAAKKEAEMIRLAGRIICENDWCEKTIKEICPDVEAYRCPLSINKVFEEHNWDINNIERHSIICTASGYTIKGLHMLLRAAALLVDKYPDLKVYVPGTPVVQKKDIESQIRKNGYSKYIEKLIKELNVEDHIVWLGELTQEELAKQYEKSHVFVMSSSIENHSSSLKEAMMVGLPSIASAVGGVPEYVTDGENGFLYKFDEYHLLAERISRIFDNDELAIKLSNNAKTSMRKLHDKESAYHIMTSIYEDILNR